MPRVLGADRADNCFSMLIVDSPNSLELEITAVFKDHLSFLDCGVSPAEEGACAEETLS